MVIPITFHAEHPLATDKSLRNVAIFRDLVTKVEMLGAREEAACVEDETGVYGNHICAAKTTLNRQTGFTNDTISVVGFHSSDDTVYSADRIVCPDLTGYFDASGEDPDGNSFDRTSAAMVTDRESLTNYLKTVEELLSDTIKEATQKPEFARLPPMGKGAFILQNLTLSRPCWREEPWTSGSIYFYLIRYTPGQDAAQQYGIFNGLSPQFEDTTLLLYDGCIDVGQTVFQLLPEVGSDGFLEYYWSNPVKEDDRVVDASGNPIRGLSPGTSVKLGYFLSTNLGTASIEGLQRFPNVVIGSGIYPEDQEYYVPDGGTCQDTPDYLSETAHQHLDKFPKAPEDGGCAIASGDRDNLKLAGLNMFLLASVLFLVVSRRSRPDGKSRTLKFRKR